MNEVDDLRTYVKEMRDNDLEYNKEQREKMMEAHIQDVDMLEARIKRLLKVEDDQTRTIGELWTAINNMRYDLDRLKEDL